MIKEGQILVVNAFGKDYEYKIRFNGLHQVLNSLSVLAALIAFECDPDKGLKALYSVPVPSGRGIKHYIYIKNQESVVIDDSYNANPSSMEASIKALKEMSGKNRSIIIIGDMKELGKFSKALHERIADFRHCMSGRLATFRLGVIGILPTIIFEMSDKRSHPLALGHSTGVGVCFTCGTDFEIDRASSSRTFCKGGTNKGKDSLVVFFRRVYFCL